MAGAGGGGGRPITLQIGSDVFSGLTASDVTVDPIAGVCDAQKRSFGRAQANVVSRLTPC
jgi:hypothetical protein